MEGVFYFLAVQWILSEWLTMKCNCSKSLSLYINIKRKEQLQYPGGIYGHTVLFFGCESSTSSKIHEIKALQRDAIDFFYFFVAIFLTLTHSVLILMMLLTHNSRHIYIMASMSRKCFQFYCKNQDIIGSFSWVKKRESNTQQHTKNLMLITFLCIFECLICMCTFHQV